MWGWKEEFESYVYLATLSKSHSAQENNDKGCPLISSIRSKKNTVYLPAQQKEEEEENEDVHFYLFNKKDETGAEAYRRRKTNEHLPAQ